MEEYWCLCQKYIYSVYLGLLGYIFNYFSYFSASKHCFCFEFHIEYSNSLEILFKKASGFYFLGHQSLTKDPPLWRSSGKLKNTEICFKYVLSVHTCFLFYSVCLPPRVQFVWSSALVQHGISLKSTCTSSSPLHLQWRNTITFTLLGWVWVTRDCKERSFGPFAAEACQP